MDSDHMQDIISKATVLVEALPYVQEFRGAVFVVKYGGSFMDDPDPNIRSRVAGDIAFLSAVGIRAVVVHGGGKAISRALTEKRIEAKFINGLRYTDADTIEVVDDVLSRQVNGEVCEMLQIRNDRPLGIAGPTVFDGEKYSLDSDGNAVDLGFVGNIVSVNTRSIEKAIAEDYTPVISPVAKGKDGALYNVNADVAAACVAAALRARRLVYLSDVPGLLSDPANMDSLISTLKTADVDTLKANGTISAGMLPKIDSSMKALDAGVHRVHFIDGRLPHSLLLEIFTDKGIGTEIVH
ncbi:MAG: acetylglutamate kinase [Opitutales bacterium]|nr:acetylglutamate kinase [Opitutales bacterium]|tara:strand:- start:1304 stop:2191 length:888 start_codon:yes stop_codon:yes gene_type:complete